MPLLWIVTAATVHTVLITEVYIMFKYVVLLGAILLRVVPAAAGGTGTDGNVQEITPGVDTLAPTLEAISVDCGTYEFEAAELRNLPDPPNMDPNSRDQIDRGIASISLSESPRSINARLILVTDNTFPRDPAYKRFRFRIEPIDPTQRAIAFVWIRDWANNSFARELIIDPPVPAVSESDITVSVRVNTTEERTVTITNETSVPQVITSIVINGSERFVITDGGTSGAVTLSPGESRTITVAYEPDLTSEDSDEAQLEIVSACGTSSVALNGVGLVGRITTEDWTDVETTVGTPICKDGGFEVENTGTVSVTITGFTSNNPNVTIVSDINAGNPYQLDPGMTVAVTELCYDRPDVGTDMAIVTVQVDNDAGDAECVVTAETKDTTVSVQEEERARMNLRYEVSTNSIRYDDHRGCMVVDIDGRVIARSAPGEQHVQLPAAASGAYFVVFEERPQVAIPVMVTR